MGNKVQSSGWVPNGDTSHYAFLNLTQLNKFAFDVLTIQHSSGITITVEEERPKLQVHVAVLAIDHINVERYQHRIDEMYRRLR
jgi:hypothetical protein